MARYAVVVFDEDNDVSTVPSSWLTDGENKCYWPPIRNSQKLSKAIKSRCAPQDNWPTYKARVLSKCGKFSNFLIFHKSSRITDQAKASNEKQI